MAVSNDGVPEVLQLLERRLGRIARRCRVRKPFPCCGEPDRLRMNDAIGTGNLSGECWHGRAAKVGRDLVDGELGIKAKASTSKLAGGRER